MFYGKKGSQTKKVFADFSEKLLVFQKFFGIIQERGRFNLIQRPDYIHRLLKFKDVNIIKILAGIRRCGKSTVLNMYKEVLIKEYNIPEDHIFQKNYTTKELPDNYSADDMYKDIKSAIDGKGHCYLLLDEVQEIESWEKVVNSLFEGYNADIYITGSNSKLLSNEISTYLSGRFIQINIFTLSLAEYRAFRDNSKLSNDDLFRQYLVYGGFPLVATLDNDPQDAYQIAEGIYATVIGNDIARRHKILNKELFDRVIRFIMENIGKTFSANSIVKFLKSERRAISIEVIYNYLSWLEEAFVIYRCNRYDIQGKSVLKTQEKFYLADISLKYSQFGYNSKGVAASLENIVYLELRRRGYEVYVGKDLDKEIDFVGIHRDEKIYIQVCKELPMESDREVKNLLEIKDHYPKYVVCMDRLAMGNENGVKLVSIADFLLQENW